MSLVRVLWVFFAHLLHLHYRNAALLCYKAISRSQAICATASTALRYYVQTIIMITEILIDIIITVITVVIVVADEGNICSILILCMCGASLCAHQSLRISVSW